jgi:hypothetical protein
MAGVKLLFSDEHARAPVRPADAPSLPMTSE